MTWQTIVPIILNLIFTAGLMGAASISRRVGFTVSGNKYINRQFTYQLLLLSVTGISLLTTYFLNRDNFTAFFSFGNIPAEGAELRIFGVVLGIRQGDSWIKTGLSLCLLVSFATAMFSWFQEQKGNTGRGTAGSGVVWIVFFTLANSFGEEMIYRTGIVAPLKGLMAPSGIYVLSAALFGLSHYSCRQDGMIKVVMAVVLGFILAKSVYETNGFFWAWTIHFLHDIILTGTLYRTKYVQNHT